ncbi:MAG: PFL family protein [Armatimonadetes bacterium]|nr:PFL family protein [Armatimonadota bacterium]
MIGLEDTLQTIEMLQNEHLDVRAVNMGVDLFDCADRDIDRACALVKAKIVRCASPLVSACHTISRRYGIPIVNKRVAVSPIADVMAGHGKDGLLRVAHTLDEAAREAGVDFIGGYSALVQKGMTVSDRDLIESLPEVLSQTSQLCASINAASTKAGINVDALLLLGRIWREIAAKTADSDGFGCCKLSVFANIPEDNPFMAGAYKGIGEPETVINIGVSGPGVVKRAIERLRQKSKTCDLGSIAEEVKSTAFRVTRCGELIGREVAKAVGAQFGIVDLSLAPTPEVGDSVGEIFEAMGIPKVGGPGTTAALAMLNDAVKKGGAFASSSVGGLSGAFIPVAEDSSLAKAVEEGHLTLEKLEAMTSVCSVGLDMIALPGDTSAETLAALAMDELAIGVVNRKTTSVRLIPVPGKKAGDRAVFGGLFGESPIMKIANGTSDEFVCMAGRIPAPLTSLNN